MGLARITATGRTRGKIGAVAVAIVFEERVLASLNVVFLSRAVSLAEAKRRYVPELQTAAREMVEELAVQTNAKSGAGKTRAARERKS